MATKRAPPPTFADLNARKRQRARGPIAGGPAATRSSLNAATLSDELFLLVFSFLDSRSLAAVERVDRHFMRLANDSILWRALYLGLDLPLASPAARSGHPSTSSLGRTIAPLPLRARTVSTKADETVDWKYLYRVQSNFSNGRSVLTSLPSTPTAAAPLLAPVSAPVIPALFQGSSVLAPAPSRTTLVVLASPYLVVLPTAPTAGAAAPTGHLYLIKRAGEYCQPQTGAKLLSFVSPGLVDECSRGPPRPAVWPTDIALDARGWSASADGTREIKLCVAWSSGAFSLFALSSSESPAGAPPAASVHERHFQPSPPVPPLHPAVVSALYGTLLVTCTDHFRLSFYALPASSPTLAAPAPTLRPFRSVRSLTSWHPATLLLAPSPTAAHPLALSLSIAYAVPCYPDLVSAALQQITLAPSPNVRAGWDWLADRSLSALAPPSGPAGGFWTTAAGGAGAGAAVAPAQVEPEVGTVNRASAIAQDDRWVCLAGADNVVQVFEIPPANDDGGGQGRLEWRQTLWAHSAGVTAVSVLDGRCVTADSTGRLLISDLRDLGRRPHALLADPTEPAAVLPSPPATPRSRPAVDRPVGWVEVLTPRRSSPPPPTPSSTTTTPAAAAAAHDAPSPLWPETIWEDAHSASTGRGTERIEAVSQDGERIVSVGVLREPGGGAATAGVEGRVKVWAFDG